MQPISFFCILLLLCFSNCTDQAESFKDWYKKQGFEKSNVVNVPVVNSLVVESEPLLIDTIYRSMQGPYNITKLRINEDDEQLVWITGYSSKIIEIDTKEVLSDEFMCHNNLDITNKNEYPWKVKTLGTSTRLFTLTAGQTKVNFPEGFGIPIPNNYELDMMSQVLNHNQKNVDLNARHSVQIDYKKESELKKSLTPLYQQTVFITKRNFGDIVYCVPGTETGDGEDTSTVNCEIDMEGEEYNPYIGKNGETYTGHWTIPIGEEVLKTDVTRMLDLKFDTEIHYIGVHVHPFAKSLELIDKTTNTSVWKANVTNQENTVGVKYIESYSSVEGMPVFKDHIYELISTYFCDDDSGVHTAMATMLLYLEDKE